MAIARDSNNAQLLVGAPAEKTYTPEIYYLEVDGKRLDGVYLGAQNKTTVSKRELHSQSGHSTREIDLGHRLQTGYFIHQSFC